MLISAVSDTIGSAGGRNWLLIGYGWSGSVRLSVTQLHLCRYVFNCVQQAAGGGGGVVSSGNPEDADNDEAEMVFLEFQVRNLTKVRS